MGERGGKQFDSLCVGFLLLLCFPPTDQKQAPLFSSDGTFTFKLPPVVFLTGFALTEEAKGGSVSDELFGPV